MLNFEWLAVQNSTFTFVVCIQKNNNELVC